jgi:hypothetical protein
MNHVSLMNIENKKKIKIGNAVKNSMNISVSLDFLSNAF